MNHILFICPDPKVKGGISTVVNSFIKSDLFTDNKIKIVSSHVDGIKLRKLIQAAVGLIQMMGHLVFSTVDIVHIHGSDSISSKRKFFYFIIAKIFKKKVVFHFHGASFMEHFPKLSKNWQNKFKVFFEYSDRVICLSKSWEKEVYTFAPGAKISVIPNSVTLPEKINTERKNKTIQFTFLGLIGERKGVFDLLKAAKMLIEKGEKICLNIGGNGDIERLNKEIINLKLENNIRFLGWISEDERDLLLKKTDIYVLPSYGEGMPMSVLEAMSYGIPVISTNVGGIPELVVDKEAGYIIEPGDVKGLFEKMEILVTDDLKRCLFGRTARNIIKKKHNINNMVIKVQEIYNELISKDQYEKKR